MCISYSGSCSGGQIVREGRRKSTLGGYESLKAPGGARPELGEILVSILKSDFFHYDIKGMLFKVGLADKDHFILYVP